MTRNDEAVIIPCHNYHDFFVFLLVLRRKNHYSGLVTKCYIKAEDMMDSNTDQVSHD